MVKHEGVGRGGVGEGAGLCPPPPPQTFQKSIIEVGRRAALAAGAVLRQNYRRPQRITLKGVIDPVTESDLKAQEIIMALIRQAFPEHSFLAEESVAEEGAKGQRWIIDPLDGTVNFAHGFPVFCVSIAYEGTTGVEYGVVYDPLRDELFEAFKSGGAWLNGGEIRVSETDNLERALLATGFPYDIRGRLGGTMARLGRVLSQVQGVRRAGSAALDLCYVACGRLDGFWEENLKPWDTAAGALMVAEAGGRLTTFDGGVFELTSANVAASNGRLHEAILRLLRDDR